MKKIFHQLHLWLGLVSGLLVFVIAITGSMYAFKDEISGIGKYQYVEVQQKDYLLPSELEKIAEEALPGKELHGIKYNSPGKATEAIFYGYNPTYYNIIYINPYTGAVQKVRDMNKDFFRFIIQGHFYLWLPPKIGQPLVAWSTLVFALLLITGLIIWIPKNWKSFKNRTWFRWDKKTKWPRMNFDLHVVGGLYAAVFGLIFAITGLVWGFQWFAQGYYKLAGGQKSLAYSEVISQSQKPDSVVAGLPSVDRIWLQMLREYPDAGYIEVHPPRNDSVAMAVHATQADGKYWKTDYRYFDQHTLQEIEVDNIYGKLENTGFADKLFRMNYEIHTGSILGLPGKIFAFLMSLFIASLPVTGVVIWWKKRRKKKH
jgi:uncharacterized iron-regulated membrane protein